MIIALLILCILAALSILGTALLFGIGPVPTSRIVKNELMLLTPEKTQRNIYELGAGFGSLAFPLAEKFPENQVIAIEISPIPCLVMWMRKVLFPRPNLKIIWGNFFKMPLENTSLIVCFLYPGAMQRLEEKLEQEKLSCTLISNTFSLPGKVAETTVRANDLYRTPIYRYKL